MNDHGAAIAMVFFGFYAVIKGYLIFRSSFLPRALGVLTMLGGVAWLAFLFQPLGYRLFPYIALISLVAVVANIGWLVIFGVNSEKWTEQMQAHTASIWR